LAHAPQQLQLFDTSSPTTTMLVNLATRAWNGTIPSDSFMCYGSIINGTVDPNGYQLYNL
jgi:hypothetical protein